MKKAKLKWEKLKDSWVLYLYDEQNDDWTFSKSWKVKDFDVNGFGWVHDSVLCELCMTMNAGYELIVE